MKLSLRLALLCFATPCFAQQSELTSVFAENTLDNISPGGVVFTRSFTPTPSFFSVLDFYDEKTVWNAELNYAGPAADQSYAMRIGKGGQIYSLRGTFGESVPPQHSNSISDGDVHPSPWVDEVFQVVAVDTVLDDRENDNKYFIHQASVYVRTPHLEQPFFSPIVAEHYNPTDKSYSVVNWGQHGQHKPG